MSRAAAAVRVTDMNDLHVRILTKREHPALGLIAASCLRRRTPAGRARADVQSLDANITKREVGLASRRAGAAIALRIMKSG